MCKSNNIEKMAIKWIKEYPNSYTLPKKQSFIDFIVKQEYEKQTQQQLKETICFDGGVSNAS